MARGPQPKRKRSYARSADRDRPSTPSTPAVPPPPPQEWCEHCAQLVLVGDAAHETHARRGIEGPTRAAAGNRSVYFDEADGTKRVRIKTHIEGLDRVLGGGLVGDSIILLTGEKGAGKSTLLLQIVDAVLRQGHSALYVAAEENASQVAERAKRLGVAMHGRVLHTTDLDDFYDDLERLRGTEDDPDLVIVDSAQTIGDLGDMAVGQIGSVAQSLNVGQVLARVAKTDGRCVILVGQETKSGEAAGSQQLPHLVDVLLELRKDGRARRYLIDPKNRFGESDEVAVFDMTSTGLREIGNITEEHLEHRLGDVGIVPFAAAHHARPVLLAVEASALEIDEDGTFRAVEVDGYDAKRLRNVLDRLQADCGCYLKGRAIRVKVPRVLGQEIDDEEIDLAVAAALLSALHNRPIPKALVFGSIGIAGHVTSEFRAGTRLAAARDHRRLQFREAIVPFRANAPQGVAVRRVRHMTELCAALWGVNIAMPRPVREEKPPAAE